MKTKDSGWKIVNANTNLNHLDEDGLVGRLQVP